MGISKYLKIGRLKINSLERKVEISDSNFCFSFDELRPSDWGYVYEKFVGQTLEDEGYFVQYQGLEKGMTDSGIDLIATKENQLNFIQCKFVNKHFSKSRIDWILYKSSNFLYERYNQHNRKIIFTLIVNKTESSFSRAKRKGFQLRFSDVSKVEYPLLQYFLDHNYMQNNVKLEFREVEMIK